MRAKGIWLALGVEPSPKHVEGTRAKLKRMVNRQVLTEDQPGVFTLAQIRRPNTPNHPLETAQRLAAANLRE